jgi:hypothetical protein
MRFGSDLNVFFSRDIEQLILLREVSNTTFQCFWLQQHPLPGQGAGVMKTALTLPSLLGCFSWQ